MNRILIILWCCVLVACGTTQLVETDPKAVSNPETPVDGPEGLKSELPKDWKELNVESFTSPGHMESLMTFFASDALEGRDSGSQGIELAARYIEEFFKNQDIGPYYETYRDTLGNYEKPAYNIVGVLPGIDDILKEEYIIIGAHYDHIGIIDPENGDTIANGANDNASGTVTVLELARYFAKNKNNHRSLIFVLFSAEEKGLLGSKHLAQRMKGEALNLYVMLNFEMTGVSMDSRNYQLYITGYEKSNLAEVSNAHRGKDIIGFLPTAKKYGLFQRSDNYPFFNEFGVPSHTFCSFDFTNFAYYHKVGDEISTMDFDHMARVVNNMIPIVKGITNAPNQEIKMN